MSNNIDTSKIDTLAERDAFRERCTESGSARPLGIGDTVTVLRAVRLPEPLGVGPIEGVTRTESGQNLYWIRGFLCARTERELRPWKSLADVSEQDEAEHDGGAL